MSITSKLSLVLATLITATTSYATNIAVADSQNAVMSSDLAKQTVDTLNTSIKPQRDRMQALAKDIEDLNTRAEKDGKVIGADELKKMNAEYTSKTNEYKGLAEGVQRRVEDAQANMLKLLMPKMEAVIEQIRTENKYDIILEKKSAIWSAPEIDITKKITDRLNSLK